MKLSSEGGLKISDLQVNSPMLKINRSCQTCHHFPEAGLNHAVQIGSRTSPAVIGLPCSLFGAIPSFLFVAGRKRKLNCATLKGPD